MAPPLACAVALLAITGHADAVPYAAGVKQIGDTVSFTLNEPADTVTITRNYNDTFLVLSNVAAGEHSFDLAGGSNYTISVTNSAPAGWIESSMSIGNPMLGFERANGVAVNNNPGSPNFGRFYVSQRDDTVTFAGRQMGKGIYVFNADATDAFGITDPNNQNAARTAGLDFSGSDDSPFRLAVGPDDTLYIGDASDIHGGIYHTDADVSTSGNLLAGLGGVQPITGQNHGSIINTPVVSGSLASGDLVLYTIDQDLPGSTQDTGRHVWRYNIGGADGFTGAPDLMLDTSTLGNNSDGSPILSDSNAASINGAIDTDITRDPRTGNHIIIQPGSGFVIMDPTFSNVLFNLRQYTLDNNTFGGFVNIHDGRVSPDGRTLAVRIRSSSAMLLFSLNDAGMPILDANEANIGAELVVTPPAYFVPPRSPLDFDLSGNIYTAGNLGAGGERLGIYSPGGDTAAVTRSNGTFTINGTTYGDHQIGDLSGDGFVGIDDLSIVLGNWNDAVAHGVFTLGDPTGDGFVGIDDLNVVLSHWNEGTPPTHDSQSNIPEPTSLWLLGAGAWACGTRRNIK